MVSNTLQDVARHARIEKLQGHSRKFDQEIGNQRNIDARIHVQHNPRTDVVDAQRGHKETQLCQKYQGDDTIACERKGNTICIKLPTSMANSNWPIMQR